jgi:hypothetical protein
MAMMLEQVRDWHRSEACSFSDEKQAIHTAMADAIDAHLTQPAQAVDVVYSESVCGDGAAILRNGEPMRVHEIVAALNATRALAGEKAEGHERSDVWVVQDETGRPVHCAAWPEACHEHINDAINEHGIEEAKAWKVLHYTNGVSQ